MARRTLASSAGHLVTNMSVRHVDFLPYVTPKLKPCRWRHRWLHSRYYMPSFSVIPISVNWEVCERCGLHREFGLIRTGSVIWGQGWQTW